MALISKYGNEVTCITQRTRARPPPAPTQTRTSRVRPHWPPAHGQAFSQSETLSNYGGAITDIGRVGATRQTHLPTRTDPDRAGSAPHSQHTSRRTRPRSRPRAPSRSTDASIPGPYGSTRRPTDRRSTRLEGRAKPESTPPRPHPSADERRWTNPPLQPARARPTARRTPTHGCRLHRQSKMRLPFTARALTRPRNTSMLCAPLKAL